MKKSNKISFKEFLDKPEPYYVVDAEYEYHNDEVEQTITDVLEEQSTGWYYSASSFYAFENPKDCDLVMTGSHIRAQEAALTDLPAAQPSGGGLGVHQIFR